MPDLMDSIVELAGKAGKVIDGYLVPAAEIAKDVINLIDQAKTVVSTDDVATLQQLRDELKAKVIAHANKTEATLRGEE